MNKHKTVATFSPRGFGCLALASRTRSFLASPTFSRPPSLRKTQIRFPPRHKSVVRHSPHLLFSFLRRNKTRSDCHCERDRPTDQLSPIQNTFSFPALVPSSHIDPSLIISLFFPPLRFTFFLRPYTRSSALLSAGVSQAGVSDCYKEK